MADVADERYARADRLAGLLAEQGDAERPLAPGLAGLPRLEPAVVPLDAESDEEHHELDPDVVRGDPDAHQHPAGEPVDEVGADPLPPVRVVTGSGVVASVARGGSVSARRGRVASRAVAGRVSVARGRACVATGRVGIASGLVSVAAVLGVSVPALLGVCVAALLGGPVAALLGAAIVLRLVTVAPGRVVSV